jgi:hypothetical protein
MQQELASQPMACARTASQLSTALLPQRERSGGQTKPAEFPEARLSPDFLTTYGVLGWMPILIIFTPFCGFARRPTLPRPLISHQPFLMVRLRIADQPRQRAHGQRRWVLFRVAGM